MARKRRKRQEPQLPDDSIHPTQERFQHDIIERARGGLARISTADNPPLRVMTQTMLDWYLIPRGNPPKPAITERQRSAGARLYAEWRAAGCEPGVTGSYEARADRSHDMTEHQADMRQRVTKALRAVGSPEHQILIHVCLCDLPAGEWAVARGIRQKSYGMVALKQALDKLERHYSTRHRKHRA